MVENKASNEIERMLAMVVAREKVIKTKWLDNTKDIFEIYEGGKADQTPFNILYSNTEILIPNVFSSAPKPVVRKRFGEMRADGASKAAERMAEYCMDTNLSGYPCFVEAIEAAVLAAALPGQGQARLRLVQNLPVIDYVQHDEFIWGYAKRWEDVPWISYRHNKTRKDLVREFEITEEVAAQITEEQAEESSNQDKSPATLALYEIWNKADKTVYFLCEQFPGKVVQQLEDPLGIPGFFPSGKPLRFLTTPVSTMPRSMYDLYRQQAEELNTITGRIKRISKAIQVKGIYDGTLPELANLFSSDMENSLTPSTNPGGMAREGGLDRHIWLLPIEKLIVVLQQLFVIREQIKSTIYEILGIGDILRGVSSASETASAQQIKDKWGSLRIKKSRETVSQFVLWYIRGFITLAAKHTPEEVWAEVTGLQYTSSNEAALLAQSGQQVPESWGAILQSLQSDTQRSYIIDIESNTTVDGDATEDKAEVADFMNALGQSMPALEGLAQQGPEGFAASQSLLVEICKRFRMGNELQGQIMAIKPQPKGPTEEQQKAQEDLDKKAAEVKSSEDALKQQAEQTKQQADQMRQQIDQLTKGLESQAAEIDKAQADLAIQKQEFELFIQKRQLELTTLEQSLQVEAAKIDLSKDKAMLAVKTAATPKPTPAARPGSA